MGPKEKKKRKGEGKKNDLQSARSMETIPIRASQRPVLWRSIVRKFLSTGRRDGGFIEPLRLAENGRQ